jgi:hypothetical protein
MSTVSNTRAERTLRHLSARLLMQSKIWDINNDYWWQLDHPIGPKDKQSKSPVDVYHNHQSNLQWSHMLYQINYPIPSVSPEQSMKYPSFQVLKRSQSVNFQKTPNLQPNWFLTITCATSHSSSVVSFGPRNKYHNWNMLCTHPIWAHTSFVCSWN